MYSAALVAASGVPTPTSSIPRPASSATVVNGAAQASDSALATAAAEMKWKNGWSIAATIEGVFSNVTTSYAGKGVVRYQW
jgi:hypothetical protein